METEIEEKWGGRETPSRSRGGLFDLDLDLDIQIAIDISIEVEPSPYNSLPRHMLSSDPRYSPNGSISS